LRRFDKTGTLTQGNASVTDIQVTAQGVTAAEILCLAASAEQGLSHPVAHAIVQQAQQQGTETKTSRSGIIGLDWEWSPKSKGGSYWWGAAAL